MFENVKKQRNSELKCIRWKSTNLFVEHTGEHKRQDAPRCIFRDQSNLVPSYVSGNYYGYYIQLGVRGYLGLKVLRLGWERFKKCIVYMAQDLCGYYTRII